MDHNFESAMEGLSATGASEESRELVDLFARHGSEEGAMLQRYQRFASEAHSPEVRYLVTLIIDEEHRHHRLLAEMANALAWGMSEESPVDAVPDITHRDSGNRTVIDETATLLRAEKNDKVELERLRKKLRPFRDTTLWELIVDLMLLDTDKHVKILSAISKLCETP